MVESDIVSIESEVGCKVVGSGLSLIIIVVVILSLIADEHWDERVPGTEQLNLAVMNPIVLTQ